jgi:group I intron endonuclease
MYVYIVTNTVNGKKYIGLSVNKKVKFRETYLGSGKLIKQAIKTYGRDNFTKHIVKEFDNESDARCFERSLIEQHDAVRSPLFYNLSGGGYGGGAVGRKVSEATKAKISMALRGRKRPEVGKKVGAKLLGKKQSALTVLKRAQAIKAAWLGKSKEELLVRSSKISKALTGRSFKKETKEKLSKAKCKLTEQQIRDICRLVLEGVRYKDICQLYDTKASCVSDIVNKKTYRWVWDH